MMSAQQSNVIHRLGITQAQITQLNKRMLKLSETRYERITRAYELGLTVREISVLTEVPLTVVYRDVRRHQMTRDADATKANEPTP